MRAAAPPGGAVAALPLRLRGAAPSGKTRRGARRRLGRGTGLAAMERADGGRVVLCVLCGLPAAGKSTLARALRRQLPLRQGWDCALLVYDDLIPEEAWGRGEPPDGEPPLVSAALHPAFPLAASLGRRCLPTRRKPRPSLRPAGLRVEAAAAGTAAAPGAPPAGAALPPRPARPRRRPALVGPLPELLRRAGAAPGAGRRSRDPPAVPRPG